MKLRKVLASVVAAATAVTALTVAASAYNFVTDDGFTKKDGVNLGWDPYPTVTVPASEFADLTADSFVKITFKADEKPIGDYWSIKPITPQTVDFVDPDNTANPDLPFGGEAHSQDSSVPGDSFSPNAEMTELSFKIDPKYVEEVKAGGLGFSGNGVTLLTLEVVKGTPANDDNNTGNEGGDNNTGNEGGDNTGNGTDGKDPVNTGIEGVAVVMGVGALAAAAIVISKKRK